MDFDVNQFVQSVNGDQQAIFDKAQAFEEGSIEPKNDIAAIALYDTLIAINNPFAMTARAKMHENGHGGPMHFKEAIRLYDKAIALGDTDAMVRRAKLYEWGKCGQVDPDEAARLYEQALFHGNRRALTIRKDYYFEHEDFAKYRILTFLIANKICPSRCHWSEERGCYEVLCHSNSQYVDEISYAPLSNALAYLNKLPQSSAVVRELKQTIYCTIAAKISPLFPVNETFHKNISKLTATRMESLLFLLWEYAKAHFNDEQMHWIKQTLTLQAFASSADPYARINLKNLANVYRSANYWLGMSYVYSNRPAGFFGVGERDYAIDYLRKAADPLNTDKVTRDLACKKLHELNRGLISAAQNFAETRAPVEPYRMV